MSFQLYKRLFAYIRPYLPKLVLAILFSIAVGAIATSPVPIVQKTFDRIFVEKDSFMLVVLPLALAALYFLKGVLQYVANRIILGISWELVVSMREKLFRHIHRLPFHFFESHETGHLISRIVNDVTIMQSTVTRLLKEFMQNSVMAVALIGWLFYMKWQWGADGAHRVPADGASHRQHFPQAQTAQPPRAGNPRRHQLDDPRIDLRRQSRAGVRGSKAGRWTSSRSTARITSL